MRRGFLLPIGAAPPQLPVRIPIPHGPPDEQSTSRLLTLPVEIIVSILRHCVEQSPQEHVCPVDLPTWTTWIRLCRTSYTLGRDPVLWGVWASRFPPLYLLSANVYPVDDPLRLFRWRYQAKAHVYYPPISADLVLRGSGYLANYHLRDVVDVSTGSMEVGGEDWCVLLHMEGLVQIVSSTRQRPVIFDLRDPNNRPGDRMHGIPYRAAMNSRGDLLVYSRSGELFYSQEIDNSFGEQYAGRSRPRRVPGVSSPIRDVEWHWGNAADDSYVTVYLLGQSIPVRIPQIELILLAVDGKFSPEEEAKIGEMLRRAEAGLPPVAAP